MSQGQCLKTPMHSFFVGFDLGPHAGAGIRHLLHGVDEHNLSYRVRAEIPRKFSALPAKGNGMYAPELRANSDEMKLGVED